MNDLVYCKGCAKQIVSPFKEFGGQCFHNLTCATAWMERYANEMTDRTFDRLKKQIDTDTKEK